LRVDDGLVIPRDRSTGMASGNRRKTTMAKLNRERRLAERRLEKQAKKEARKRAAAEQAEPASERAAAEQAEPASDT
jgi:hypothetical protein